MTLISFDINYIFEDKIIYSFHSGHKITVLFFFSLLFISFPFVSFPLSFFYVGKEEESTHVCMCEPEVDLEFPLQSLLHCILSQGLSLNWSFVISIRMTAQQALGLPMSLPSLRLKIYVVIPAFYKNGRISHACMY